MRNNVNHLNSPLVLQLHPLDQPASCSSLYTLFSFNGSDEYSARFWHTTNAITLYSSRTVGTAATQLEPSVTSANFIQFLDLPTDDDCLPGPTQCDFTVRATYCPGGYQGVSTVAVEGLTKVTCCPIDSYVCSHNHSSMTTKYANFRVEDGGLQLPVYPLRPPLSSRLPKQVGVVRYQARTGISRVILS